MWLPLEEVSYRPTLVKTNRKKLGHWWDIIIGELLTPVLAQHWFCVSKTLSPVMAHQWFCVKNVGVLILVKIPWNPNGLVQTAILFMYKYDIGIKTSIRLIFHSMIRIPLRHWWPFIIGILLVNGWSLASYIRQLNQPNASDGPSGDGCVGNRYLN